MFAVSTLIYTVIECSPLQPGLVDGAPGGVHPVQPAHVVHHLVVKVEHLFAVLVLKRQIPMLC